MFNRYRGIFSEGQIIESSSKRNILCAVSGLLPATGAVLVSPEPALTAVAALPGVFFAWFTTTGRNGLSITLTPAVCWLATIFAGALPGALTAVAALSAGFCRHHRNSVQRNLFISMVLPSALMVLLGSLEGPGRGVWLLIPAGALLQLAGQTALNRWNNRELLFAGINWLVNGLAASTIYFYFSKDGFSGAAVVTAVIMTFVLHAWNTGSRLTGYTGRIGTLSVQNRLLSLLYQPDESNSLFFHEGGRTWTTDGKPATGIPSPESVSSKKQQDWSFYPVGNGYFITSGSVSQDLDSMQAPERWETLKLLETVWRASFARTRLENAFLGAAGMLVRIADKKDSDTHRHSIRVSQTATALGRILGLNPEELFHLRIGALLHDIGKLSIPSSLIMKKGLLTEEERKIIETHPAEGARLLQPMERYGAASRVVLQHHERIDGTGYPAGLTGREISLHARIVAVADAFDAITSPRAYHLGKPAHIALREIRKFSGTRYDPAAVRALEELIR